MHMFHTHDSIFSRERVLSCIRSVLYQLRPSCFSACNVENLGIGLGMRLCVCMCLCMCVFECMHGCERERE